MDDFATNIKAHYKKIILCITGVLFIYTVHKYIKSITGKKPKEDTGKKPKEDTKPPPTIANDETVEKIIEELPLEQISPEKSPSLKDLLSDLEQFSDDEDWQDLIASVKTFYNQNPKRVIKEKN